MTKQESILGKRKGSTLLTKAKRSSEVGRRVVWGDS